MGKVPRGIFNRVEGRSSQRRHILGRVEFIITGTRALSFVGQVTYLSSRTFLGLFVQGDRIGQGGFTLGTVNPGLVHRAFVLICQRDIALHGHIFSSMNADTSSKVSGAFLDRRIG